MTDSNPGGADLLKESVKIERIGSRAVQKAQEESRRLGVPNVYSHNGIIYYELPNGQLTIDDPFEDDRETDGI